MYIYVVALLFSLVCIDLHGAKLTHTGLGASWRVQIKTFGYWDKLRALRYMLRRSTAVANEMFDCINEESRERLLYY